MGGVNKGILFSRGFPLLTAVDGWFYISFLSRSPPGCGSRQPDFFFFLGCEIQASGKKNGLGTDASTFDRKRRRGCIQKNTAAEEA